MTVEHVGRYNVRLFVNSVVLQHVQQDNAVTTRQTSNQESVVPRPAQMIVIVLGQVRLVFQVNVSLQAEKTSVLVIAQIVRLGPSAS